MPKLNTAQQLAMQRKTETKKCANPECDNMITGLVKVKLCKRCYINQYRREQRAKVKKLQGE
jgi:hypothetical protein